MKSKIRDQQPPLPGVVLGGLISSAGAFIYNEGLLTASRTSVGIYSVKYDVARIGRFVTMTVAFRTVTSATALIDVVTSTGVVSVVVVDTTGTPVNADADFWITIHGTAPVL